MDGLNLIQKLAIFALPMLFAITVHEAAHGWVAMKLGDKTAFMLGRITLNPLKHIDPVGTVLVPLALVAFTGFAFGWAKPVPVDWRNLRQPKRDMGLVALAGPVSNLLMAVIWGVVVLISAVLMPNSQWLGMPLLLMGVAGVIINCLLMALNLLPILPLDGGRVLASVLPPKQAMAFSRTESFGLIVVMLLMVTGVLGDILWPVIRFTITLLPASNIVSEFLF